MLEQNLAYFDRPPRSDKIKSENRQKSTFFTFLVIKLTWCDQKLMKICMSRAIFGARAHCNAPRGPAPHIWRKTVIFDIFRNISKYFEIFRNISKYFEIFQNISKYFEIFRNISKYFEIFWNISKYFEIFRNISKYFEIFRNISKITVFRQIWGAGPLGALQWARAPKIARDIQIFINFWSHHVSFMTKNVKKVDFWRFSDLILSLRGGRSK